MFWMKERGRGGYQDFPPKIFCLIVPNNSLGTPFVLCFRNFPVAKKFMDKRGRVSSFSVEKFFSHSAENFRTGIFYCSIKFKFKYRKMLVIKERGDQQFLPKFFCHIVPNIS